MFAASMVRLFFSPLPRGRQGKRLILTDLHARPGGRAMEVIPLKRHLIHSILAVLALFAVTAHAQPNGEKPEKPKGPPPIKEGVEDLEKREGFFILWANEKKNKLLAEIPSKLLGKEFLVATSLSFGPLAGLQTNDLVLKFERRDEELLLMKPNIFYKASGDLADVVEYSYPDEVLARTKITGQDPNGNVLIDLKSLLESEASTFAYAAPPGAFVEVAKAKSFETNSVVELRFRGETSSSGIYFNIGQLKDTGYKPRKADPRVGYFLTAQHDFSKDDRADTTFDRFINRWHLEKQDPSLSMSPPKEPIVMYIEHTVPVKYRRWVREGIESWNKAFEAIGYVDAIEVRQQTKTNDFANLDPEDARYNFFRWIASQRAFAIAPSRVNPRTGQVLDSDILFDESMVRYYIQDYKLFVDSVPETRDLSPRLRHRLARNPWEHPLWNEIALDYSLRIQNDPSLAGMTPEKLFAEELTSESTGAFHRHGSQCAIGHELSRELALAGMGLEFGIWAQESESKDGSDEEEKKEEDEEESKEEKQKSLLDEWPEEFIGPLVREIVAHEVGHSLGLRHNFKASSWKSYEEIVNATDPEEPTSGSVMDYNPFTLRADGSMPDVWITPTIGPYDIWAIEYGYSVPGSSGYESNEEKMLSGILDKVTEDGHDYGTDEDVSSPDPLITRWDLGSDSLTFFKARVELADRITEKLLEVVVKEDESWAKAKDAYMILIAQRARAALAAAKYVGGYDLRRDHKGDPNARPPITVIPGKQQREALELITEVLFAEDSIEISPEIQNHLAAGRWYHQGSYDWLEPLTPSVQDVILRYQNRVLFLLLNTDRIGYLYDAEFHAAKSDDILTLAEMMQSLTDSIWSEVQDTKRIGRSHTLREPMISTLRRNLQREYVSQLVEIATAGEDSYYPAVARTLAWKQLKNIREEIDAILEDKSASKLDAWTAAHLDESRTRIARALEPVFTLGGNQGGLPFMFMIMGNDPDANGTTPAGQVPMRRTPLAPGSY